MPYRRFEFYNDYDSRILAAPEYHSMQQNRHPKTPSVSTSVGDFVQTIFDSYQNTFDNQSVTFDCDFENVMAVIDNDLIAQATRSLIDNAIQKMPTGGSLSATLIDGQHQWELEIADSFGASLTTEDNMESRAQAQSSLEEEADLPTILPFPETESLRHAFRNAIAHNGNIQTWDCPQGGTAHVLVIPKRNHSPTAI